ncbi:MAG: acetyl-CoA carboxylase biotin carboxylase subunit [Proteobacteria bacterium]|nr:acetyl-CoA carboxylase biotin carboxylase subunit [Pseudomonadota bacterium]
MKKILIANRGEIALRIIRTAREMGLHTVAVHSECDAHSMHVRSADESVCIGGNRPKDSYLNIVSIMSACELTGADAIHPGYGFLSENSEFAAVVERCGIKFIGPKSTSIKKMGSKVGAREIVEKAGVPVLPGTPAIQDVKTLFSEADRIGFPVLIKASHGGGGRGMRVVSDPKELEKTYHSARSESQTAFASSEVFLEKYVARPRHIEIQIIADSHGNVVYLGERECTLQRRHQKVIEEAPSPVMTEELRKKMGQAACEVAKAVEYEGLGTIEFIVDEKMNFYFMEMNTRIQVEHPVTEFVTGLDLVKEQINVARGEKLPFKQEDIIIKGHSIECRINAEDPFTFVPCPGTIKELILPGGRNVRVDTAAYAGAMVPPFYDSMIGKLVTFGANRQEAQKTMLRALGEFTIEGIKTNIPLHKKILGTKNFPEANFWTKWIEDELLA